MSVIAQLKEMLPELSRNERKVADYLLEYPYDVQRFSSEAVAAAGTPAAVQNSNPLMSKVRLSWLF